MQPIEHYLAALPKVTVLCIGDLMLDQFIYGDVSRVSPEAPAMVVAVAREEQALGGAGNVVRGIAALGARSIFIGIVGDDDAGRVVRDALASECPGCTPELLVERDRPTTRKVQFVSQQHSTHLLRADWEMAARASPETETAVIAAARRAMAGVDAVILSDYGKGVLDPSVVRAVIDEAVRLGKPVVVDPKGHDYSIYRGATLLTPNRLELAQATRRRARSNDEVVAAAQALTAEAGVAAVLVTRSEDGMTLVGGVAEPVHIPAYPVKVRDVSGAGDTVAATMAAMIAAGADFELAARAANAAAAVVVGKQGTSTVSAAELRSRVLPAATLAPEEKIVFDWAVLDQRVAEWRRHGLRIGFTNGCFDLLHPGHVRLLTEARGACDRLIVGLNSDASVTRLKGSARPIQHEQARAEVLAALAACDLVVIFDQDTPADLIARVRPSVLVKGADYRADQVIGRELVEAQGGRVLLVDLVPGHSTTRLVEGSGRNGSA